MPLIFFIIVEISRLPTLFWVYIGVLGGDRRLAINYNSTDLAYCSTVKEVPPLLRDNTVNFNIIIIPKAFFLLKYERTSACREGILRNGSVALRADRDYLRLYRKLRRLKSPAIRENGK